MNQGMDPQDQRNFIIAMVLMIAFVFGYQALVVNPEQQQRLEAQEQAEAQQQAETPDTVEAGSPTVAIAPSVDQALAANQRLAFDAARVDGSIRLTGAILDDLNLKDHFTTVGLMMVPLAGAASSRSGDGGAGMPEARRLTAATVAADPCW